MRSARLGAWLLLGLWVAPVSAAVDFARDVQPIFTDHCAKCHGGVKRSSGLSVLSRELIMTPAKSGLVVINPGDARNSELYRRVSSNNEDERMPPDKPLSPNEVAVLKQWIQEGAPWPGHWAYQPVRRVPPPALANERWSRTPVDRFVGARLEQEDISPAPEADRRTLIRRLSLDLLGLLPTPAEVEAFVADESPRAYEDLVDRLLASPHFGERWARHWLDLARYADSAGFEKDSPRNDAWRWRQWVIDAINEDLPFDEFTVKQIAGDLLPNAGDSDRVATAFHLQTLFNLEGGVDPEEDRVKRVTDRVNTVGLVWLGTTVGCMQCHNHPYDPMAQEEFYRLFAFFNNADNTGILLADYDGKDRDALVAERAKKVADAETMLHQALEKKDMNNDCQRTLVGIRNYDNSKGFTRVLYEREKNRRETYVFHRGDFLQPKIELGPMTPDVPAVFPRLHPRGQVADRLDLANWLVSPDNPVTARVAVNRVWYHLFGGALVGTLQDFGTRGAAPTHPELLDWLADWFMHDASWSRKELVRLIVNSATYRQSAAYRPELAERDPDNKLLARQNRFRVEGEIVRDVYLQAAGLLASKIGGPSVFPPLPEDVRKQSYANNFKWKESQGTDRYRRGMYTFFKRTATDPNLMNFDCPDANLSVAVRDVSNSPTQALQTLQNEVFMEAAQALAARLLADAKSNESRLEDAYQICLGRAPQPREMDALAALLADSRAYYESKPAEAKVLVGKHSVEGVATAETAAWMAVSRVLLNLDEFLTRQ